MSPLGWDRPVLMGANGMMSRSKGPYKVSDSELEECKKTSG